MSKPTSFRGALCGLAALICAAGCSSSNQPDPFMGTVFTSDGTNPSQFDSKFVAQSCGKSSSGVSCRSSYGSGAGYACPSTATSPCYPVQLGYAHGQPIYFYNLQSMTTGTAPVERCLGTGCPQNGSVYLYKQNPMTQEVPANIPVSDADPAQYGGGGAHVDIFPHSCTPGAAYNAEASTYPTTSQFPIFNNLPLSLTANQALDGAYAFPFVATYSVTLTGTETCNDIKDSRSIADATNPGGGSYGATRAASPTGYQLWAPIDDSSTFVNNAGSLTDCSNDNGRAILAGNCNNQYIAGPIIPNALNPNFGPQWGWYKGLLLRYLDGGPIPTQMVTYPDGVEREAFVAMDGVIVDPSSGSSDPTDDKVIILPAAPGDDAYSPIVNLHHFKGTIGSLTSICLASDPHPCPAGSVDFTKVTDPSSYDYTIFIVSTPQQTN